MNEQDIQKKIIDYINKKSGLAVKQNNIGIYANKGIPDILFCYKGKFGAIEVKRTNKDKPSPIQQAYINYINKIGGYAIYTNNLEDVELLLKSIK